MLVYLTCYRVLDAAQDARAGEILKAAGTVLQQRVATIQAPAIRKAYLENVPANRKILQLVEQGEMR